LAQVLLRNWKRFIATLCVALVALILAERGVCSDPCASQHSGSYSVTTLMADQDDGQQQSDSRGLIGQLAHHCVSAHASALPQAQDSAVAFVTSPVIFEAIASVSPRSNEQHGPERPPRGVTLA